MKKCDSQKVLKTWVHNGLISQIIADLSYKQMVNNIDLISIGPWESVLTFEYKCTIFAFLGMVLPQIK